MNSNSAILNISLTSKAGYDTPVFIQRRFVDDEKICRNDPKLGNILCTRENNVPDRTMATELIDFVIGFAGSIAASYAYDLLKKYITGTPTIIKEKDTIHIETRDFVIKISSDGWDPGQLNKLVDKLK